MGRKSTKQTEIYDFLCDYLEQNRHSPSVREIAEGVGLRSTATVHYHLTELKRMGKIEMDEMKKRTISIPYQAMGGQIPVLGVVTAGLPILAQENIEGYLPWSGDPSCYALRVRGDSMIGAGILDGDRVIVRPQQTALDGQIVVALLGEEATVKRIRFQGRSVTLVPENPIYPMLDGRNAKILGVVRAVFREYK